MRVPSSRGSTAARSPLRFPCRLVRRQRWRAVRRLPSVRSVTRAPGSVPSVDRHGPRRLAVLRHFLRTSSPLSVPASSSVPCSVASALPSLVPRGVMPVMGPMAVAAGVPKSKSSSASMRPNGRALRRQDLRAPLAPAGSLRLAADTAALRRAATARVHCPPRSSAQSPPRLPIADSTAVDTPLAHTARFAVPDRPGRPWVSHPTHLGCAPVTAAKPCDGDTVRGQQSHSIHALACREKCDQFGRCLCRGRFPFLVNELRDWSGSVRPI